MTDTPPDAPAEDPAQKPLVEENGALGLVLDALAPADGNAGPYTKAMDEDPNPAPTASALLISELTHRHLEEVVIPRQDQPEEESLSTGH